MEIAIYSPGYETGLMPLILKAREDKFPLKEIYCPEELLKTKTDIMIIDPTPEMNFKRIKKYIEKNSKTQFLINMNLPVRTLENNIGKYNNVEYLSIIDAPKKILNLMEKKNDSSY